MNSSSAKNAAKDAGDSTQDAARDVSRSRGFRLVARSGYAVNGILHALIGGIAISIALGEGGSADQSGALAGLAATPGGVFVLWFAVVGLVGLGAWQVVQAIIVPPQDEKRKWAERAKEFGKAVAYLAVASTAFTYARGGSSDSSSDSTSVTATLLESPVGVALVVALGLAVIAIGGYFVFKGATKKFHEDVAIPGGTLGRAVDAAGVVGYIAKGVALAVVGILFIVAGVTHDASEATGLDGALKSLTELPFGQVILWVVGAGLIAFGVYCFARARWTKL
ncbi:DUF1206 domain-containing protein [Marisediminicola sp. LYQ134]|uniref:DUF1206 domain-containing protein n=1 Tax=unclassified Marisediminicola TaxID=2618316 RepID=UPI0039835E94